MYAIIDVAGQQFKVEKGQKIFVHHLDNEEGVKVDFDKVLLIDNNGKIIIGEPLIKSAFVEGQVLEHKKGDKVIVFKKKRRKGFKVKNGHRQEFSHIEILSINEKGADAKIVEKPAAKTKTAPKAKTVATASTDDKIITTEKVKTTKTVAKKPVPRKVTATAKKPAATKTATTAKKQAAKTPVAKKAAATKTKVAPKTAKQKATPKKDASKGDAK